MLKGPFRKLSVWEYGFGPKGQHWRRHRIKFNVQFILWEAGEQGHQKDFWHNTDKSWWPMFKRFKV